MNFMDKLQGVLRTRTAVTENGAVGYQTSGKELVDLNFAAASLRKETEREIVNRFVKAFYEDKILAMKWLFFLRDARGGLGERRSFRVIAKAMAYDQTEMLEKLIDLIAEYGRYDDLLCLLDTPLEEKVLHYIKEQLYKDMVHMKEHKTISLCGKWLPGNNASCKDTRNQAKKIQNYLGMTAKEYRKMLVELRSYLQVIEVAVSANRWDEIDYEKVPAKANLLYRKAFMLHDEERRKVYLQQLAKNEVKINAGILMPHEIVGAYTQRQGFRMRLKQEDAALEELWKHLDDTVKGAKDVLCIVDGSGSMTCPVGDGSITALQISNALGIYFAERMKGVYQNKFITFSARPQYVNLAQCQSLREKLQLAFSHNDCTNTNLEASFDLILETAVINHLPQKELPKTVLIISDMEFDAAVNGSTIKPLLETICDKFRRFGYHMPKLVFWNCNSRSNVIPIQENEMGVGLVSGFSVNVCNMVLSNKLDPYECLKQQLNGERYQVIGERLAG